MHPNPVSGAAVQVRLTGTEFDSLENWRRAQEKIPPRSEAIREAIRRLVKQHSTSGEAGIGNGDSSCCAGSPVRENSAGAP